MNTGVDARAAALVVVLAGGGSGRLGHDKLAAALGRTTVLDTLLGDLAAAWPGVPVTVVGPQRATATSVTWRHEDPPGGGPVAGLARALGGVDPAAVVAVVAGDHPFATPALPLLVAALGEADAAIGVDPSGRDQPLLGAYVAGPLLRAVGAHAAGQSVRGVVGRLTVVRVPLLARWCLDVDTPADLDDARREAGEPRADAP